MLLKNQLNIPSLLMLLVYLASWWVLHMAPSQAGYVVLKKECARKEARVTLAAKAKKQGRTDLKFASAENKLPDKQIPVAKVCSVLLALPPETEAITGSVYFTQTEEYHFRNFSYLYHFSSREPDPPRFA